MPVLGLVRAHSVEHAVDVAVLVTEHGGLGHTSAIYAHDDAAIEAYSLAVRTGRILVNAPTAVGALGGVYNNLTPTFSLGCGTWGGSSTTENVNYLQLLNIKTVSYRRTPPQWFRVPSNTFFNAGALENLREIRCESRSSSPTPTASPGVWSTSCGASSGPAMCRCSRRSSPSPTRPSSGAGSRCSTGPGPTWSSPSEVGR